MSPQARFNLYATGIALAVGSASMLMVMLVVALAGTADHQPARWAWVALIYLLCQGLVNISWATYEEVKADNAHARETAAEFRATYLWSPKFKDGDLVRKATGYPFDGVVRAAFRNSKGDTRYVVELDRGNKGDMLHIFSENQLEKRD